ncbi:MAG: alpha/beta hydrolase [Eubacteriales bacterium]
MKKAVLYIHGKGGSPAEADHYKSICEGYDVFGLDYQGSTPWDTKEEFQKAYGALTREYGGVILIANSIGAYFTMNALGDRRIEKALFISPIVNMEKLITDMMMLAGVTEAELKEKGELATDFGEVLSWEYLTYVREHPIKWNTPTEILYAGHDALTSVNTVTEFAVRHGTGLTVMENGEHWFHTEEQMRFLDAWVSNCIKTDDLICDRQRRTI